MFQCFSLCFLVLQSLFETQACKLAKPLYRSWVNLLRLSSKQSSSCGSRKCVTSATSLENLCSLYLQDCIFNVLERTVCEDVKKNVRSLGFCPFVFIGLSRSCKISLSVQPFSEKNSWPLRQRAQSQCVSITGQISYEITVHEKKMQELQRELRWEPACIWRRWRWPSHEQLPGSKLWPLQRFPCSCHA